MGIRHDFLNMILHALGCVVNRWSCSFLNVIAKHVHGDNYSKSEVVLLNDSYYYSRVNQSHGKDNIFD